MNAGGVLGSMCFPSFPSFSGRLFGSGDDKELGLEVLRAYNDWHIDEWCGAAPGRFIPMAITPVWDPEACRGGGAPASRPRAATRSRSPRTRPTLGYQSFHSPVWDPLWEACCEHDVVVSIHLGLVGQARHHRQRRPRRRDDHAAADEHLPGRGRPAVVADPEEVPRHPLRAVRGRHRLDPVLPRPRRSHLRHAPPVDRPGVRRRAAERRVPRATSSRASSPIPSASRCATRSASTTSPGSATTRTPTRRGRRRPRSSPR